VYTSIDNQPDPVKRDPFVRRLLEDSADSTEIPDTWRPAPGDYLDGELVRVVEAPSGSTGQLVPVAHIRNQQSGETLAVWLTHHVLRDKWQAAAPQPGERVGIVYQGEQTSSSGRTYKKYRLEVDRTPEQDQVRVKLDEIAALIGADPGRADRTLTWLQGEAERGGEVDHAIF